MSDKQLALSFVAEMDRQAEAAREAETLRMKRANAIAILRAVVRQYPMTDYERQVIPKGVRLARFVIKWECEKCPYACEDHSLGNKFGLDTTNPRSVSVPLVCLKDYYEKGYDGNIFREAKELIKTKPVSEMTEEEGITYKAAMILVNLLPEYNDIPILDDLESLANILDGKEERNVARGKSGQAD